MVDMTRIYIALAIILALLGAGLAIHHNGVVEGRAQCEYSHSKAAEAARNEIERRDTAAATATTDMLDYLQHNLPPIEVAKNETVERIRTIYRDSPVPGVCVWNDRVRDELEKARVRANASAGSVRPSVPAAGPANPGHGAGR